MDFVGKKVRHVSLGEGTVLGIIRGDLMQVDFGTSKGIRKFPYPAALEKYLSFVDEETERERVALFKEREEESARAQASFEKSRARSRNLAASRRMDERGSVERFSEIKPFCDAYKKELYKEIGFVRKNGGKKYRVYDGKFVEMHAGRYVYSFESEDELNLPDNTDVTIERGQDKLYGKVVSCEEFTVIISVAENFGKEVSTLEFSAEPWKLLEALGERLDEMAKAPSKIVKLLVTGGAKALRYGDRSMAKGQDEAVQMGLTQKITFIWGPPGTGKTQTLAKLALKCVAKGERVLMVSYSNVSVDGAALRVRGLAKKEDDYKRATRPGVVLRYGYPRQKEILEDEHLSSYNYVLSKHPDLRKERERLLGERKRCKRHDSRYVNIEKRLSEIREGLRRAEGEAVQAAFFVATTISKAVIDVTLRAKPFDVVIFDEASMAYVPQVVFAASLAKKRFICMGDFCQLPPIVQSDAAALEKDIFKFCGITDVVERRVKHEWLCLLNVQRRMHPEIAGFVSDKMYKGLLNSAPDMAEQRAPIAEVAPLTKEPLGLVDLSGLLSVAFKTESYSRVNVLSAFIDYAVALQYALEYEVGVITPYNAQARLLNAMARDVKEADEELRSITCATVHAFQGSEKDIVLYDAVDCCRMSYPGRLLTATGDNNTANRLFNVAVSRSRGKFLTVANVKYLERRLNNNLIFGELLDRLGDSKARLAASSFTKNMILGKNLRAFGQDAALEAFKKDLLRASKTICLDVPDAPRRDGLRGLVLALKAAHGRGVKVTLRVENKDNLPEELKGLGRENSRVWNPVTIIDRRIVWYGMPFTGAKFTSDDVPVFSYPVFRWEGVHAAKILFGLLEMNNTLDGYVAKDAENVPEESLNTFAAWLSANYVCDECGEPVQLKKSKHGKFFIGCSGYPKCEHKEWVTVDMVNEYISSEGEYGRRCPRCNYSMEAKRSRYGGVYVECTSHEHSFRLDEI